MPKWRDRTIWSPDERKFKEVITTLFKSNYTRDELKYLLDKALYTLCLCDWELLDCEAQQLLNIGRVQFTKVRDSLCLERIMHSRGDMQQKESDESRYYRTKIAPQREALRRLVEAQRMREACIQAASTEQNDESLCADQRLQESYK